LGPRPSVCCIEPFALDQQDPDITSPVCRLASPSPASTIEPSMSSCHWAEKVRASRTPASSASLCTKARTLASPITLAASIGLVRSWLSRSEFVKKQPS
jgi:hypothetical protein